MIQFPKNFLWGAATSSYQVEGNNAHADWWHWEKEAGKENSGEACRHYQLYEQDFDVAKNLNHNCHRLSIEWSRIEPEEGKFSQHEIQHYINVIRALRARNIEPMVTLHHFTNPLWLSQQGGWQKKKSVECFLCYVDYVTRALAQQVHYWITINEPTIYASHAFLFGAWPPQAKSFFKAKAVYDNLIVAHSKAYRLMNTIYSELHLAKPAISISQHVSAYVPCTQDAKNRYATYWRNKLYNFHFLDTIMRHRTMDFVGINYYSRQRVDLKRWGLGNLVWDTCSHNHNPVEKNSLGWDIYPEGLYMLLLKLKKFNLPIIITENGICTLDDNQRWEFIVKHLHNIHRAMQEGVNVAGYLYWSLLDNFEWDKGFGPRFGLVEVDYVTQQRRVRSSAYKFGDICRTGIIE